MFCLLKMLLLKQTNKKVQSYKFDSIIIYLKITEEVDQCWKDPVSAAT